ncbi:G protein-coupled receptor associated sorting protein 3 isoform X2 [Castor canadensis]|uniref:G protein-coupled receptor associated sorting protein 3 isoform X2 n=1 Tax=Castor canadensis TaxID=51338 RepID=A0AC58LMA2_CASCN
MVGMGGGVEPIRAVSLRPPSRHPRGERFLPHPAQPLPALVQRRGGGAPRCHSDRAESGGSLSKERREERRAQESRGSPSPWALSLKRQVGACGGRGVVSHCRPADRLSPRLQQLHAEEASGSERIRQRGCDFQPEKTSLVGRIASSEYPAMWAV